MSSESTKDLFVRRKGRVEGPWSVSKIRSEIKHKKLARYHEISEDGREWVRASDFEWLFPVPSVEFLHSADSGSPIPVTTENEGFDAALIGGPGENELANEWYIADRDFVVGPMTSVEVIDRIQSQEYTAETMIWCEMFDCWARLGTIEQFAAYIGVDGLKTGVTNVVVGDDLEATPAQVSTLAVVSFVCSLFFFLPLVPLVGVVVGFLAMKEIRTGYKTGKRLALAGIALGIVSTIIFSLLVVVMALSGVFNF